MESNVCLQVKVYLFNVAEQLSTPKIALKEVYFK